jgi:hypothetical protein
VAVQEALYDSRQAARGANIPPRRLQGWLDREVFTSTVPADGRGSRRRFSRTDVIQLALLDQLRLLFGPKVPPGFLAEELQDWMERFGVGPGTWLTATPTDDGRIAFSVGNEAATLQRLKRSTVAVVVHLERLVRRVDAALREL